MMSQRSDWLPGTQEGQLDMGRNWARILGTKAAVRTELIPVHRKAVDALDEAKD